MAEARGIYCDLLPQSAPGMPHIRSFRWDYLFNILILWCRCAESNGGPTDYESVALPTELHRQRKEG
jgi:hypothetical protein